MATVQPGAPAVHARGRRLGGARRGFRPRHPAHPRDPGTVRAATRTGRSARLRGPSRTGPEGPASGTPSRSSWTAGASAAWPAGAVVVILSDGWDRGDVAVLAEQMARIHSARPQGHLGQPPQGRPRLPAPRAGHGRRASARGRVPLRPQLRVPRGARPRHLRRSRRARDRMKASGPGQELAKPET